jgi:hypothetical protein
MALFLILGSEEIDRVLAQDYRSSSSTPIFFEMRHPAVGREQARVGTEENLTAQAPKVEAIDGAGN